MRSIVAGIGGYLPEKFLTNKDLEARLETSDEWIRSRVGIEKRHIAAEGELTSDLAVKAAKIAMNDAGVSADDIDLIIVATTTPDYIFPATAVFVQSKLGIKPCTAFDVQAVCSGFIYALNTADLYLKSGQAKCALVIGAETMSRILDWNDRGTCVLFGDGAGAFVLKAEDTQDKRGIIETRLYADGNFYEALYTHGGVSQEKFGPISMNGRLVFKYAIENMVKAIKEICANQNLDLNEIDYVIAHQANQRILEGVAEKLDLPVDKVISTIAMQANTSAATIPLSFYQAQQEEKLKKGMKIMCPAMGAGFTWGASYIVL